MDPQIKLAYSVAEACAALAIGKSNLYEMIAEGIIPARKLGRRTIILAADLRRFAEALPPLSTVH
jgi:excisionase family DNA binding protein